MLGHLLNRRCLLYQLKDELKVLRFSIYVSIYKNNSSLCTYFNWIHAKRQSKRISIARILNSHTCILHSSAFRRLKTTICAIQLWYWMSCDDELVIKIMHGAVVSHEMTVYVGATTCTYIPMQKAWDME